MNRFCLVVFSGSVFAACAAADFIVQSPSKARRTVLSQDAVPVLRDEHGNPFLLVGHERIGIEYDNNAGEGKIPSELVVTRCKDQNGKICVEFNASSTASARDVNDSNHESQR